MAKGPPSASERAEMLLLIQAHIRKWTLGELGREFRQRLGRSYTQAELAPPGDVPPELERFRNTPIPAGTPEKVALMTYRVRTLKKAPFLPAFDTDWADGDFGITFKKAKNGAVIERVIVSTRDWYVEELRAEEEAAEQSSHYDDVARKYLSPRATHVQNYAPEDRANSDGRRNAATG